MLLSEITQHFKKQNYKPLQYCYQNNIYGDETIYFDTTNNIRIIVNNDKYYINNDSFDINDFVETEELPTNTDMKIINSLKENKKKIIIFKRE
ncbi:MULTISPECIES: hypothetical protein [unclassified Tatumella]|uniref:hypothetical protein n=1 Tax=unclassified Tatumella TaxID=2649542 RepID=UPI001BAEC7A9|nr:MULTISPECIES: hypothetical protein [unclassified Tatumella]MBS0876522.1 hypothetical protein [Tatumella sp. JGM82]MBS0889695.1 hypothetical protein [Tatumella sp. JGM94]MBS0900817.1 hypothetical protein [Tatumella sp. JGM100]